MVVAPDSFKGSASAAVVAGAIAQGWHRAYPADEVVTIPLADGGEGTLDAIAHVTPEATWMRDFATGPDFVRREARWLMVPGHTAVIEMAQSSGLPLMRQLDPRGATSRGLGDLINHALDQGAEKIVVTLGGSATTDAGLGLIEALGARVRREGGALSGAVGVVSVDTSDLRPPPPGGITVLTDTQATMVDAPRIFGPQKGASEKDVEVLTVAFRKLLELSPPSEKHQLPGSGAAGGTAWALCHFLGATMVEGAPYLSSLVGLDQALRRADFVVTGEGRLDHTSFSGKVVGYVHQQSLALGVSGGLVVGASTETAHSGWPIVRLIDLARSADEAIANPEPFLVEAGRALALALTGNH